MRNGQKRMRGRDVAITARVQNPLTRVYESNGPDVKIRGTASHVAEKYIQLARDVAEFGRPGCGRELLPACRALLPPDRRRAGTVPSAEPILQSSSPHQQGATRRQEHMPTRTTSIGDDDDGQPFMGQNEAELRTA